MFWQRTDVGVEGAVRREEERERKARKENGTSHSQNANPKRNPGKVPIETGKERETLVSSPIVHTYLTHLQEKRKFPFVRLV